MGLDITAYSKLRRIGEHDLDPECNQGEPGPWCYYKGHIQASAYDFPQSFRGIPLLTSPRPDAFALWGGCYETTPETRMHAFRAGSYGGYNQWRANLQEQFNPERHPDGPFYELIWFADNEGTIGPEAAADLLADFRILGATYTPPWPEASEVFADWGRAFELAADGGLIDFH